jgi:DNA-binding protein HU-beta
MNKTELIDALAAELKETKTKSAHILDAFCNVITKSLSKGHDITIIGFGSFGVTARAAREGRNPQTGAKIKIAASKAVRFRPGKALKDAVNKSKK